jgi:hypothetical protein
MWTPRGGSVDVGESHGHAREGLCGTKQSGCSTDEKTASGITGCTNWNAVGLADGRWLTGIL